MVGEIAIRQFFYENFYDNKRESLVISFRVVCEAKIGKEELQRGFVKEREKQK